MQDSNPYASPARDTGGNPEAKPIEPLALFDCVVVCSLVWIVVGYAAVSGIYWWLETWKPLEHVLPTLLVGSLMGVMSGLAMYLFVKRQAQRQRMRLNSASNRANSS